VKVGDLVRVNAPVVYIGIVMVTNVKGGALVRSLDGNYEYWIYDWSGEVLSESR
jgi:hypothetical protein